MGVETALAFSNVFLAAPVIVCERSNARNDTVEKRSWQGF
jgi:hypothetical protein